MTTNIPDPKGRPVAKDPVSPAVPDPARGGSVGSGPAGNPTSVSPSPASSSPASSSSASSSTAPPSRSASPSSPAPKSGPESRRAARGTGRDAAPSTKQGPGGSDWSMFRTVVVLVGLILAGFGAYYLILGTQGLPDTDAQPVNPTLENQFRFFSAMMVGVGAAFVTIAVKFQWANMLWLVCLMVFAGGIGRVLSWAFSGTPHYLLIILMVVELAFPAALLVWHKYITKTAQLRKDFSSGS